MRHPFLNGGDDGGRNRHHHRVHAVLQAAQLFAASYPFLIIF
jgi:hypothetical protein